MALGVHLHAVLRSRRAVVLSLLTATLAMVLSLYRPTLTPPGLHPRGLVVAAASSELLVADPRALPASSYAYAKSVNQALLAGNVILSPAVLGEVAQRLGLHRTTITGTPPVTPNVPAALVTPGPSSSPLDIFSSPNQYKLEIEADPSTPFLWLYAQAPSGPRAIALANLAAQTLVAYVRNSERADSVPAYKRVHIEQVGSAVGRAVQTGAPTQIGFIVWVGVFCLCLVITRIGQRLRDSWARAGELERAARDNGVALTRKLAADPRVDLR